MLHKVDADQRVRLCRGRLLQDVPFFGLLAMRLNVVEDPTCRDMWTDSVTLGFNPRYVAGLLDVELEGLMVHVTGHILSGHPWRQGSRESKPWNEAADYALNPVLQQSGYRLPTGALVNEEFDGLCAEVIYEKLQALKPKASPPPPVPDSGDPEKPKEDESDDSEGATPSEPTAPKEAHAQPGEVRAAPLEAATPAAQAEWKLAIEHASDCQGSLSRGLQRLAAMAASAQHNWKEELHDFVQRSFRAQQYRWSKPNRRHLWQGLYLPSREGQKMPDLVVARDTSGSVSDSYLASFNANLAAIIEVYQPETVWVVDCDAQVTQVVEVLEGNLPKDLPIKGGGGTRFSPVFEWVEKQGIEPACLVYFTDLCGSFPEAAPDYPVLWAVPESTRSVRVPPFGESIVLRFD